mgnify:CR=1 FL=1
MYIDLEQVALQLKILLHFRPFQLSSHRSTGHVCLIWSSNVFCESYNSLANSHVSATNPILLWFYLPIKIWTGLKNMEVQKLHIMHIKVWLWYAWLVGPKGAFLYQHRVYSVMILVMFDQSLVKFGSKSIEGVHWIAEIYNPWERLQAWRRYPLHSICHGYLFCSEACRWNITLL